MTADDIADRVARMLMKRAGLSWREAELATADLRNDLHRQFARNRRTVASLEEEITDLRR